MALVDLVWSFEIDGNEVLSYVLEGTNITYKRRGIDGDLATITVEKSLLSINTITAGMSVVIRAGTVTADTVRFRGLITSIELNEEGDIDIVCHNNLYRLKYLLFSKSYDINIDPEAGEISAIAEDIITDGGLTASSVATGTDPGDIVVRKFISERKSRFDKLVVLAEQVNYNLFEDYQNNWIRFEPVGSNTFATNQVVGTNVYNVPDWQVDIMSMRNRVYVDGANEEDTREESFNGNGSKVTFQLTDTPETLEVTVGGVLQVLGVEGGSTTFDYTVDKDLKTITFESGSIPPSGTNNVVIKYTTLIPYTSVAQDDSSFDTYNIWKEENYNFDDIRTVEDADTRAAAILEQISRERVGTYLETEAYDIKAGMLVSVEDQNNTQYNGTYVVEEVVLQYPSPVVGIKIGTEVNDINELMMSYNDRLNILEGRRDLTNEILRQIFIQNYDTRHRMHYVKIGKYDVTTSDDLVWDDNNNGTWADDAETVGNDWADDTEDTFSEDFIIQGHNKYNEFVHDEDFHDSVNSTATFNTSTKTISFTAGQVWQSLPISKGFTPTSFTMLLGVTTGTLLVEISADGGSTFQTVTNFNQSTLFDSADNNGVIIRITENNSSTASITNVSANGRPSQAAVYCYIE